MKSVPTIAVIVVNFRTPTDTIDCLQSLTRLENRRYHILPILIDNASPDDSVKIFKQKIPHIKLIESSKNLGFAGGNNIGIRYALENKADYVLLLNSDAKIIDSEMLVHMLNTGADIVGPVVEFEAADHHRHFDYGGMVDDLFGRNTHLETDDPQKCCTTKPDYLSGVCLLIKTKVIKKIGFLDEKYFLYYEDADFCLRAQKAGFTLSHCKEAKVWHQLSLSTNKLGKKKMKILAASQFRFCTHHLSIFSFPFYFSYTLYLLLKSI